MRWRRLILATSLSPHPFRELLLNSSKRSTFFVDCKNVLLHSLGRGGAQKGGGEATFAYIINTMNTPHRISKVLPTA